MAQTREGFILTQVATPLVVLSGSDFSPSGPLYWQILGRLAAIGDYRFEYRASALYDEPRPHAVVISEELFASRTRSKRPHGRTPRPTLYLRHAYAGASTGGQAWYADSFINGEETTLLERTLGGSILDRLDTIRLFLSHAAGNVSDDGGSHQATSTPDHEEGTAAALPRDGSAKGPRSVFLCHASADKAAVRQLYRRLAADGFAPWFDEESLRAGQDWRAEIVEVVRTVDFVVVCLSKASTTRAGYVQREIKDALDVADEQPDGSTFVIPVRLEDCEVPRRLRHLHWVDLFAELGYARLVLAMQPMPPEALSAPVADEAGAMFYIEMDVDDHPSTLARVAQILAVQGVMVTSMVQTGPRETPRLTMLVRTAEESRLLAAAAMLGSEDIARSLPQVTRAADRLRHGPGPSVPPGGPIVS